MKDIVRFLQESIFDDNIEAKAEKGVQKYMKDHPNEYMTFEEFLNKGLDVKYLKRLFGQNLKSNFTSSVSIKFSDGWLHCHFYYDCHRSNHGVLFSEYEEWPNKSEYWDMAVHMKDLNNYSSQQNLCQTFFKNLQYYEERILKNKIK